MIGCGGHSGHGGEHGTQAKKGIPISVWLIILVGVGYYLWGWHKDHVLQYWPIAIFALCPLMHLFHGGGHGGHGRHQEPGESRSREEQGANP